MASQLYVLYEHASGYAVLHVQEAEDIGVLLPAVEKAITDFSLFASAVKLISFCPFKSSTNALDNINAISEGILHDDLKLFLGANVPMKKKVKVFLGIGDTRLSGTILEEIGIKCISNEAVAEVLRGVRLHFPNMVKGLTMQAEAKAQLGLSHSYSRSKVKFNVNRADNMIIQSIALLDQLDKDINTFSMRVKEWYSYHFPELVKICSDNYMYCKLAKLLGNRKKLSDGIEEKLEEITMDSSKVQAILSASKMSMGMDVSPIDLINIESFCGRVISLTEYRRSLVDYLHKRMQSVAPNLSTLIGDVVGARLISHAGSLTSLAKYPASTVQILGAEKALFRALKSKGNTPKYGLIFHSTFIGRAGTKNKGRISRCLANKCSLASRIDCFSEHPNSVFGEKLKDQVEERLKFYESGEVPRKNVDVMKEAVLESDALILSQQSESSKEKTKKKKKKKRKIEIEADGSAPTRDKTEKKQAQNEMDSSIITIKSSKEKKQKLEVPVFEDFSIIEVGSLPKPPKKKKKKNIKNTGETQCVPVSSETSKKKKKRKALQFTNVTESAGTPNPKKKKVSSASNLITAENNEVPVIAETKPKKKKKKHIIDTSVLSEKRDIATTKAVGIKSKKKLKS